ncbi:LON peptidase substrate-binding domain-containing protein [Veronia pacifica]|uniref:Lon N-terminal domain-containing protein n=1 Tax=Veronia pacifica TaxID=1080227 RepID=A0A1C3ELY3_9GAMM|nr:LON peptidase substrate-binding domain-containing protein [Veronia pacifica]ODA34244.1 hypothetical protein A8L45_06775 [Veronia pacifica]
MPEMMPLIFSRRHVLPSGRLPLLVLPGEQQNTLVHALKTNQEFGLGMTSPMANSIITKVAIEDFSSRDGNRIMLILRGLSCFRVNRVFEESEGVLTGECTLLPDWPQQDISEDTEALANRLLILFERFPDLQKLYVDTEFENLTWLCQRWLELLPLCAKEKQILVASDSCRSTCDYLMSLMDKTN